jgi:hypothetical protein
MPADGSIPPGSGGICGTMGCVPAAMGIVDGII